MNETGAAILHSRLDVLTDRSEHVRLVLQTETWRRDSNNGVRLSFENERPADRVGASSVGALPQAVTDDGNRRGPAAVFLTRERATTNKRYAQHREQLGRNLATFHLLRSCGLAHRATSVCPSRHRSHRLACALVIEEIGI